MATEQDPLTFVRPFTAADVFIYLIPGAAALSSVFAFEFRARRVMAGETIHTPLYTALKNTVADLPQGGVFAAGYLFLLLALVYLSGHVVSSVSSICIDRTLVFKGHGYPYRFLLRFKSTSRGAESYSEGFYRGLFFWSNVYLVWRYCLLFSVGLVVTTVDWVFWCLIGSSTALKLLSHPTARLMKTHRPGWFGPLRRLVVGLARFYSVGYDVVGNLFAKTTNSRDPFDPAFIARYKILFLDRFGVESDQAGTNNYWFVYCYLCRKAPEFYRSLLHWLNLYELSRNLATAFYVGFTYCFCWMIVYQSTAGAKVKDLSLCALPIAFWVLAHVMLSRYYYLYVCYYTKFLFRAFVYLGSKAETEMATGSELPQANVSTPRGACEYPTLG